LLSYGSFGFFYGAVFGGFEGGGCGVRDAFAVYTISDQSNYESEDNVAHPYLPSAL